jgi:predicted AAA+ superfamily ATPase
MAHTRDRHIASVFKSILAHSPIVGLFGHRQVGKTTWISNVSKSYVTLDQLSEVSLLRSNPESYLLNRLHPFAIDEAQTEPSLFPALKEAVRKNSKPGQFIITGSVRFSSRKQIRESLTGRIISWEMIPMDLAELHSFGLSDRLIRIANSKSLEHELVPRHPLTQKDYTQYLKFGGLPGLFSIRNEVARNQKMELQIETLLERDLRMIVDTKISYDSLRRLITELANQQLEPFEIYPLARRTQISVPTLMGLMRALEAIYLIRWIPSIGSSRKKSYIFEDQGEATYLQTNPVHPLHDFIRFLYANLRTQWHYQNKVKATISQMRSRSGQWIPWVIQGLGKSEIALLPTLESAPNRATMGAASAFLRRFPQGKVLIVHHDFSVDRMIHPQIRFIPWNKLV